MTWVAGVRQKVPATAADISDTEPTTPISKMLLAAARPRNSAVGDAALLHAHGPCQHCSSPPSGLWVVLACACRRAADTEEEAEERAEVLAKAGVVLRFNGMVYLRPQEVSELVYRVRATQPPRSTAAHSQVPRH